LDVVKWLVGEGADVLRMAASPDQTPVRASMLAEWQEHSAVAAYLREAEAAAEAAEEAAARAEQEAREAEARRARNEKRRQKQKRAKARRQQQEQQQHEGVGAEEADEEEQGGGSEASGEEAGADLDLDGILEAALAGLSTSEAVDAAEAQQQQQEEEQDQEQEHKEAEAVPVAIAAPLPERPPPLEEYLEAHVPDDFMCPITMSLLADPVVLAGDGFTYSRATIEQHFAHRRQRAWGRRREQECGEGGWLIMS
jgi:hypothetical protein